MQLSSAQHANEIFKLALASLIRVANTHTYAPTHSYKPQTSEDEEKNTFLPLYQFEPRSLSHFLSIEKLHHEQFLPLLHNHFKELTLCKLEDRQRLEESSVLAWKGSLSQLF